MLSAVVITCNDSRVLDACLRSLAWVDEVVVADMHSEDDSVGIARKHGSAVVYVQRSTHVEMVRDTAIRRANGDWVLVVDPDERIPRTLAEAIGECLIQASPDVAAIQMARKNLVFGRWVRRGGWWPDQHIRVLRKDSAQWPQEIHASPRIRGKILSLQVRPELAIEHIAYDSLRDFVEKTNRYTDVQAVNLLQQGVKPSTFRMIWSPCRVLVSRLLYRLGFLDGGHGLMFALLYAWYFFLLEAKLLTLEPPLAGPSASEK